MFFPYTEQVDVYMAGLTNWHLSKDTPRKSSGVPARPQNAATGASLGSAKAKCEDVTNQDKEMDVHPTKNASDQELKHWADLMGKQKPENLFDDDVNRCLTITKVKATTGDTLKATVPQSVVCTQSSTHGHGPGGDGGPEAFTSGKKYARWSSALKENVKDAQK